MSLRDAQASVVSLAGGTVDVITVTESWDRVTGADSPEFVAWAEARDPRAVREVKQVTHAGLASILAGLEVVGEHLVDPVSGEVVPGLRHQDIAQWTYAVQR